MALAPQQHCQPSTTLRAYHLRTMRLLLCTLLHATTATSSTAAAPPAAPPAVNHSVHIIFTHHLDVGLDLLPLKTVADCAGYATQIVQRYFNVHIPRALRLAKESRARVVESPETQLPRFVYQLHSWIVLLYVDCTPWIAPVPRAPLCPKSSGTLVCPSSAAVAELERALRDGDVVHSSSPFDINAAAAGDPNFIAAMVRDISGELDRRYTRGGSTGANGTAMKVWTNIDVKGFARSAIPALRSAGIEALYVGSNGHPTWGGGRGLEPVVANANATIFRWIDPVSNTSIPVMYHLGYGGFDCTTSGCISTTPTPTTAVTLACYYRADNEGPPATLLEADAIFAAVKLQFPPSAVVRASSIGAFAREALTPTVIAALPTTRLAWGDQWITGLGTDPLRVARVRS